jgi:hypothetical protein
VHAQLDEVAVEAGHALGGADEEEAGAVDQAAGGEGVVVARGRRVQDRDQNGRVVFVAQEVSRSSWSQSASSSWAKR